MSTADPERRTGTHAASDNSPRNTSDTKNRIRKRHQQQTNPDPALPELAVHWASEAPEEGVGRGNGQEQLPQQVGGDTTRENDYDHADGRPLFSPRRKRHGHNQRRRQRRLAHETQPIHWLILFLACMLLFGNYYCYDIPAALNVQLQDWIGSDYKTYQWQLNMLYSVYSAPNVVLPVVGGFLVDRLGPARMLIVFSLCVVLGQSVFAWGVSSRTFSIMVLGRLMFGLGGESLEVAQARVTTDWFRGRGLGFALSLNLAAARLATAVNDNLSPAIQEYKNTAFASWFGAFVCVLSGLCGIWMVYLDRPERRRKAGVGVPHAEYTLLDEAEVEPLLGVVVATSPATGVDDDGRYRPVRQEDEQLEINTRLQDDGTYEEEADDEERRRQWDAEMAEDEKMRFGDILTLQASFWVLCLLCILLYGSVVPFIHISSDFLQTKWYPGNPRRAGAVMSIPDIVSAIGSPMCGFLIDKVGHRGLFLPVAGIILASVHLILGFTYLDPSVGLVLLGIAYSMFASSIWPCIPHLVGTHQLGTAYGLMTVALNISLTLLPLVVAALRGGAEQTDGGGSDAEGFAGVMTFFIALSVTGILLGVLLNVLDARNGSPLQHVYGKQQEPASATTLDSATTQEGREVSHRDRDAGSPVPTSGHRAKHHPHQLGQVGQDDGEGDSESNEDEDDLPDVLLSLGGDDDDDDDANITTRVVAEGVVAMIPHFHRGRHPSGSGLAFAGGRKKKVRTRSDTGARRSGLVSRRSADGTRRRSSSHPPPLQTSSAPASAPPVDALSDNIPLARDVS